MKRWWWWWWWWWWSSYHANQQGERGINLRLKMPPMNSWAHRCEVWPQARQWDDTCDTCFTRGNANRRHNSSSHVSLVLFGCLFFFSSKWPTEAHLMSFHAQYMSTRVRCEDRTWWRMVGLDSASVHEFPVQHLDTQRVPESDWHLLQQLVSVGFKFYILLHFTDISKTLSGWQQTIDEELLPCLWGDWMGENYKSIHTLQNKKLPGKGENELYCTHINEKYGYNGIETKQLFIVWVQNDDKLRIVHRC